MSALLRTFSRLVQLDELKAPRAMRATYFFRFALTVFLTQLTAFAVDPLCENQIGTPISHCCYQALLHL